MHVNIFNMHTITTLKFKTKLKAAKETHKQIKQSNKQKHGTRKMMPGTIKHCHV